VRCAVALLLASCSSPPATFEIDRTFDRWDALALPITGDLRVRATLDSRGGLFDATGFAFVACDRCTLGDGDAKLSWPQGGWFGEHELALGATGRLPLGLVGGTLVVVHGRGIATLHGSAPDGIELWITGAVSLADDPWKTSVDGHVVFRANDGLRAYDPTLYSLTQLTGAMEHEDHSYHIHVSGPVDDTTRRSE
jgi:hypothetical protein